MPCVPPSWNASTRAEAVSYTHLDVYKRQRDEFPSVRFPVIGPDAPSVRLPAAAIPRVPPFMFREPAAARVDVYKRQVLPAAAARERLAAEGLLPMSSLRAARKSVDVYKRQDLLL